MNVFDYFFENSKSLNKNFILGNREQISFKDLYNQSLALSVHLQNYHGEGKNIILIAQNSIFFVVSYLAILKSGNVCVPLDYSIEQTNLDFILNQTESELVFSSGNLQSKLNFTEGIRILDEKEVSVIIDNGSNLIIKDIISEDTIAEIVFTSGSTGIPKGVMLSHKNIIANTSSIISYLKLTSEDIICVVLPFHYCYGLSLLHTHLRAGGSMVINNTFMFIGSVINDLKEFGCTGFAGVPSHFQILLKRTEIFKKPDALSLRYLTQAGGKLHNQFIQEICEAIPDKEFYVMYGQTEATARLSYLDPSKVLQKLGSIGKGIPGVELRIVNELGEEVDNGIEGELIAKGNNIMVGYYKDEEGTNCALKDNWLYTGDYAKKDNEGYIFIVARKKEILKVRGKRVSPKEIEEVILSIPEVIDCTIKGYEDIIMGEGIEATIVIRDINEEIAVEKKVILECKNKLAAYKIPTKYLFKDQMTLKSSGKK